MIWDHWDKGTRDATLALYRHADPDRLAAAGKDLGQARLPRPGPLGRPRPLPPDPLRRGLRRRPPRRQLEIVAGAGHWPWIDDPSGRSTASSTSSLADRARPSAPVNARITIGCSVSRAFARVGAKLPKGWGDARAPDRHPRRRRPRLRAGPRDRRLRARRRDRPRPAGDRLRALDPHLLRAQPAGVLPARALGDRPRQPGLPQRPVLDRARLPGLALPLPQRVLLLRPQHVRRLDGPGPGRLHALPDRAAADVPRARLRRHDQRLLQRQPRLGAGENLHQPLRGGAEHALRLRADDRRHRLHGLPPLVLESLLGLPGRC